MGGRGVDTGVGSWAALILLLVSSSVVLVLQWDKECDGGLRTWLLTTVCVTAICGILGAAFHGKGDGTRPSRFLDDDDDDVWGVGEDDDESIDVSVSSAGEGGTSGGGRTPTGMGGGARAPAGNGAGSIGGSNGGAGGRGKRTMAPPHKMEEGGGARGGETELGKSNGGAEDGLENARRDSLGEDSIVSGVPSSISFRIASQSSSLQHRYFGPGPKVFPDAIFFILVVSQWFLAGWSVVGAALYFRLFNGNRTCSPLLRHWTLLVVIIGFLSCLLAVCYSGIMCCMLGGPFKSRRRNGESERDRFHGDVPSSSDGAGATNAPGLM